MTRTVKRTVPAFLAALLTAAALCAAGTAEGSTGASGGPMAIEVMHSTGNAVIPDPADDPILQGLNKALNINLTLTAVATEYAQQVNVRLAAGNYPDFFSNPGRSYFVQYANDGVLMDLSSYESQYPDFLKMNPDAHKMGILNGKRYALATNLGIKYPSFWIRKDWFDKLGLAVPETLEDFKAAAVALAEKDPDGNGKKDTYGFSAASSNAWDGILAAFGLANFGNIWEEDGVIKFSVDDPRMKEALAWIRDFIATGAVDPGIMTITKNTDVLQKMAQQMVGMVYCEWPVIMKPEFHSQITDVNPDAEWIQFGGLIGPNGKKLNGSHATLGARQYYSIPAAHAKDMAKVNKAIEVINYCATEEGYRLTSFGLEGVHYTVENNTITALPKLFEDGGYFWVYQFGGRKEVEYLMTKFAYAAEELEFAGMFPNIPTLDSGVDIPEGYNHADASRYMDEEILKFIYGKRPLSEYDGFLNTLKTQFQYKTYQDSAIEQLKALGFGGNM